MRISQDRQTATVRRSRPLHATVREFELLPDTGCNRPAPGRHLPIRLATTDGRLLTRHDALLGRSDDSLAWRIAVQRGMPSRGGSAALHALPLQNHFGPSLRAPQHLLGDRLQIVVSTQGLRLEVAADRTLLHVNLSPAERDANRRLCACVSRVRGGGIVLDTPDRPDPV